MYEIFILIFKRIKYIFFQVLFSCVCKNMNLDKHEYLQSNYCDNAQ